MLSKPSQMIIVRSLAVWLVGIILAATLYSRLVNTTYYALGNIQLLYALNEGGLPNTNRYLVSARDYFVKAHERSFPLQASAWRLAYTEFLLKEYDSAALWMQIAQLQERPSFMLNQGTAGHHVLTAVLRERNNLWLQAIEAYRTALALEPQRWDDEFYRRYYQALIHIKNEEVSNMASLILEATLILEPTQIANTLFQDEMTDWLLISQDDSVNECWQLTHIQYASTALDVGPLVPVNFLWQHINNPNETYQDTALVVNLAPNGGFEWGIEQTGQPVGYPYTIYNEDNLAQNHQLVLMEVADSDMSTVAGLRNSATHYNSSFSTHAVRTDLKTQFVQSGWLKRDNSNGHIGYGWPLRTQDDPNPYQFMEKYETHGDWIFFAALISLPENIQSVDLLLTNYNSEGSSYFDDLLFFEVNTPPC